jgi:hypothetical protein
MVRRSIYIALLALIWLGSMALVTLWLDAALFGGRALGCFLLAGGVGAAMTTVALAEEATEMLRPKAQACASVAPALPQDIISDGNLR